MSFKLSNTYLKLFIMTAAASAMLVGSECLHRLYFDIVPLGRPWEEFLYLLTFTSILCFSRWAFTKVCAAFGSVRISVSGEVIPGAAQRGCPLYLRCSMPDLMR